MNRIAIATVAFLAATSAHAASLSITSGNSDAYTLFNAVEPGTNGTFAFDGYRFSGDGTVYDTNIPGVAIGPSNANYYMAVDGEETINLPTLTKSISLLWATPDPYNSEVVGGITVLGQQVENIAAESGVGIVTISSATPFSSLQLYSSQPAFEFQLKDGVTPAPEASTWAMLVIGFASLGYAAMRKRHAPVSI